MLTYYSSCLSHPRRKLNAVGPEDLVLKIIIEMLIKIDRRDFVFNLLVLLLI